MRTIPLLAATWLLGTAIAVTPALAESETEIPGVPGAPDFSEVITLEQAQAMAENGELERVLLFPAALGGADIAANQVYLPPEAAAAKRQFDATIERFVADGLLDQMNVSPAYRGKSVVPAIIRIEAWHSQLEGKFNTNLDIW